MQSALFACVDSCEPVARAASAGVIITSSAAKSRSELNVLYSAPSSRVANATTGGHSSGVRASSVAGYSSNTNAATQPVMHSTTRSLMQLRTLPPAAPMPRSVRSATSDTAQQQHAAIAADEVCTQLNVHSHAMDNAGGSKVASSASVSHRSCKHIAAAAAAADVGRGSVITALASACDNSQPGVSDNGSVVMQKGVYPQSSRLITAKEMIVPRGSSVTDGAGGLSVTGGSLEVVYRLTGQTGSCMTMAPEIRLQQPYNEKIDVYAFGVVMYEIWSRSLLALTYIGCKRPDLPRVLHKCDDWPDLVVSGYRPSRIEAIPEPVWQLITECWHQDPLLRPTMAAVEARLRRMAKADQAEAVIGLSSGKGGTKLPSAKAGQSKPTCDCTIS